jgi:hypothetical protein
MHIRTMAVTCGVCFNIRFRKSGTYKLVLADNESIFLTTKKEIRALCPVLRIPDPGSGAFLTPGSGMGKNQDPDTGLTIHIIFPRA